MGNGSELKVAGVGNIKVRVVADGCEKTAQITNVLHVPMIACSLLSVSELARRGFVVHSWASKACIKTHGLLMDSAILKNR